MILSVKILRLCLRIDCFFYSFIVKAVSRHSFLQPVTALCVTAPHEFKIAQFERFFSWNFLISIQHGWMQTSLSGLYVPLYLACSGQKCGLCCKVYWFLLIAFTSKFVAWNSEDVKTLITRYIKHTHCLCYTYYP